MAVMASVFPILPGKMDEWRAFTVEMAGPRKAEHAASRQRLGITKEQAFHQGTPMGDMAIVYVEAPDVERALMGIGTSQEPFDVWFRERVLAIHGFDFAAPPPGPPPEQAFNYSA